MTIDGIGILIVKNEFHMGRLKNWRDVFSKITSLQIKFSVIGKL